MQCAKSEKKKKNQQQHYVQKKCSIGNSELKK